MSELATHVQEALEEFLEISKADRRAGNTIADLKRTVATVADGLAAHEIECHKYRRENEEKHRSHESRLRAVEAAPAPAPRRTLFPPPAPPPTRESEASAVDLAEFAREVVEAAREGEKAPDKTPEESIEAVVERKEREREEKRELAELRARETQREASAAARRKLWVQIVLTVMGSGGVVELLHALLQHRP